MKKTKRVLATALSVMAVATTLTATCFATEYIVDAPKPGPFAKETSTAMAYVEQNVDKSKNAAIIPPTFGSATSYVPVINNYLTPNLVPEVSTNPSYSTFYMPNGTAMVPPTSVGSGNMFDPAYGDSTQTDHLYYNYNDGDTIGTLSIPTIGVSTTVYEGTSDTSMRNGVGHFSGTGVNAGNICIAGHNRGISYVFGQIHLLNKGDNVYLTVDGVKKQYDVVSVSKISVNDATVLNDTANDQVTLITCVANQPSYRWCVVAQ